MLARHKLICSIETNAITSTKGIPISPQQLSGLSEALGPERPEFECPICNLRGDRCNGHYGYIKLSYPFVLSKFEHFIVSLTQLTCPHCKCISTPPSLYTQLITLEKYEMMPWYPFDDSSFNKHVKNVIAKGDITCSCCNEAYVVPTPIWGTKLYDLDSDKYLLGMRRENELMTNEDLYYFLGQVSYSELQKVGLCLDPNDVHPAEVIRLYIPIPPSHTRNRGPDRGSDRTLSMTPMYKSLFEKNQDLNKIFMQDKDALNDPEKLQTIFEIVAFMAAKYDLSVFADDSDLSDIYTLTNTRSKIRSSSSTSMIILLAKKAGEVQGKMGSVRTVVSGRAVLGGEKETPTGSMTTPISAAKKMSTDIVATEKNIDILRHRVLKGPDDPYGVSAIITRGGRRNIIGNMLRAKRFAEELEPGDVVMCRPTAGTILFDLRYPSIRPTAMLGGVMLIGHTNQVKKPTSDTTGPNADFDGDVMFHFLPRTLMAKLETVTLMGPVQRAMASNGSGFGFPAVEDINAGARLLKYFFDRKLPKPFISKLTSLIYTLPEYITKLIHMKVGDLDFNKVFQAMQDIGNHPKVDTKLTVRDMVNMIMPRAVSGDFGHINIVDGAVTSGYITDKDLGTNSMLLRAIHDQAGRSPLIFFFDNLQRIAINLCIKYGSTFPWHYYVAEPITHTFIDARRDKIAEVLKALQPLNKPRLLKPVDESIYEFSAKIVFQHFYDLYTGKIQSVTKKMTPEEALDYPERSSKKTTVSIQNAVIGGTMVECPTTSPANILVPMSINSARSLYCYRYGESTPESRGFSKNGYVYGLTPQIVTMHGESNVTTFDTKSNSVAEPGYMSKKLAKSVGDAIIGGLGEIRFGKRISSFTFGSTYSDPNALFKIDAPFMSLGLEDFKKMYTKGLPEDQTTLILSARQRLCERNKVLARTMRVPSFGLGDQKRKHDPLDRITFPIDIHGIINQHQTSKKWLSEIPLRKDAPKTVAEITKQYQAYLYGAGANPNFSNSILGTGLESLTDILTIILSPLMTKGISDITKLYQIILDSLVNTCIQPGTPVGIRSSLDISANLVQLFLDAIHQNIASDEVGIPIEEHVGEERYKLLMSEPKTQNKKDAKKRIPATVRVVPSNPTDIEDAEAILKKYNSVLTNAVIDRMPRIVTKLFAKAKKIEDIFNLLGYTTEDMTDFVVNLNSFLVSPIVLDISLAVLEGHNYAPLFMNIERSVGYIASKKRVYVFFEPDTQRDFLKRVTNNLVTGYALIGDGKFYNGTITTSATVDDTNYYLVLFNSEARSTKTAHVLDMMADPLVDEDFTTVNLVSWSTDYFGIVAGTNVRFDELIAMAKNTDEFDALPIRYFRLLVNVLSTHGEVISANADGNEKQPHGYVELLSSESIGKRLERGMMRHQSISAHTSLTSVISGYLNHGGTGYSQVTMPINSTTISSLMEEMEDLL